MKRALVIITLSVLTGCHKPQESKTSEESKSKPVSSEVSIWEVTPSVLKSLISDRRGKILFVNVWATWCAPCVEEFPDLVHLASDFKDSDIDFVAISVDDPEDLQSKVVPFLKEKNANLINYLSHFRNEEELFETLVQQWDSGSWAIPTTIIFDKQGKQQSLMIGSRTYSQFKEALQKLLQSA